MIGERRNCDPGLILSIDFTRCDGEYFRSQDAYGNKVQMSGSLWRLTGAMFNGVDDYIDLGAGKPTDLTGDITISARVNIESYGENNEGRIIDNGKFIIRMSAYSTGRYGISSDGSTFVYCLLGYYKPNTWTNIIVTRNSAGDDNDFYINGALVSSGGNSGTPVGGTTNTFIGNRDAGDRTFDGQIVNIKIWNREIGEIEESRRMFQEGRKAA